MLAITQVQALVLLFVVLPFVVAGGVIAFVSWRAKDEAAPTRTSAVLASGEPGDAEILGLRSYGGLLDTRPMVRLDLRITTPSQGPFELQVTQSLPRPYARSLRVGDRVEVRVLADRSAAAVLPTAPGEP